MVKSYEKIIKKSYKGEIWNKFIKGVKEYKLIDKGDKIAVAISGGKDSLLLAKLMQSLSMNKQYDFTVEFISMDPGFSSENRKEMEENFELLEIPVTIFKTDIFEISEEYSKETPCYLCARMRRGALYNKARELGCNKVALGHHLDDVVETIMLSMLYTGSYQTMMPKLKSENFEGMEIIRPLYFVEEKDIISYTREVELIPMGCGCRISDSKETPSKRAEVKKILDNLYEIDEGFKWRIFKSSTNVNLDKVLSYNIGGSKKEFLDEY